MATIVCKECHVSFEHNVRGRPPVKCLKCRGITTTVVSQAPQIIPVKPPNYSNGDVLIQEVEQPIEKPKNVTATIGAFVYEVFVTNLGFAYRGEDEKEANLTFKRYQGMSMRGFGQCGNELVKLYHNGEIVQQFTPMHDP
jgi:hypothetical protein